MTDFDLKKQWHKETEQMNIEISMSTDELKNYKRKSSDDLFLSIKRGVLFDSLLKLVLIIAALYLYVLSDFKDDYAMFIFISIFLLAASFLTNFNIVQSLKVFNHGLTVTEKIRERLEFMNTKYRVYLFSNALTAPQFVLIGNAYYFHFKYQEMNFDFVTSIFIMLALAIGYFSQLPIYFQQKRFMAEMLSDFDAVKAINYRKYQARIRKIILFTALLGLLLLAIILTDYTLRV